MFKYIENIGSFIIIFDGHYAYMILLLDLRDKTFKYTAYTRQKYAIFYVIIFQLSLVAENKYVR